METLHEPSPTMTAVRKCHWLNVGDGDCFFASRRLSDYQCVPPRHFILLLYVRVFCLCMCSVCVYVCAVCSGGYVTVLCNDYFRRRKILAIKSGSPVWAFKGPSGQGIIPGSKSALTDFFVLRRLF